METLLNEIIMHMSSQLTISAILSHPTQSSFHFCHNWLVVCVKYTFCRSSYRVTTVYITHSRFTLVHRHDKNPRCLLPQHTHRSTVSLILLFDWLVATLLLASNITSQSFSSQFWHRVWSSIAALEYTNTFAVTCWVSLLFHKFSTTLSDMSPMKT